MQHNLLKKPIFIVGCPRSGTTLVHSIFNNHPALASFPEPSILYHLLGDFNFQRFGTLIGRRQILFTAWHHFLRSIGHSTSFSNRHFRRFLTTVERPDLENLIPLHPQSVGEVVRAYFRVLDQVSAGNRWVDKTCYNMFVIDLIEKYGADSQFVHVIRDGRSTIASLRDAANKHEQWREFRDDDGLARAIALWNRCLLISKKFERYSNHVVVRYEDVAIDPNRVFNAIGDNLGLQFDEAMFRYEIEGIAVSREPWKQHSSQVKLADDKSSLVFSSSEQRVIDAEILNADTFFPRRLA